MLLFEHKGPAFLLQTLAIARLDRVAGFVVLQPQVASLRGEMRTRGEADEVVRIREWIRFVKIIYAPDQAALGIAPGSEILDMQIADREHMLGLREFGADLRPDLRPAIEGGAK